MNAGLTNLKTLKTHLLAEKLREDTSYDDALTALGLGVAAAFERYCNRKFARVEDDTDIFSAQRTIWVLPRYPLESVDEIAFKFAGQTDWTDQSSTLLLNVNNASGMVHFGGLLGGPDDYVRLTYTGGYWWNTNEDTEDTIPTGATALPDDLKLAWLLQCKKTWESYDANGTRIAREAAKNAAPSMLVDLELIPAVTAMLAQHRRLFS